jgi:hypothetical protein
MPDDPIRDPLLDRMAALPGCDVVVLLDLDARTVLDGRWLRRPPHERLDALGVWAADMLENGTRLAIAAGDTALRLAFRTGDGDGAAEAVCVVLHPGADAAAALALVPGDVTR